MGGHSPDPNTLLMCGPDLESNPSAGPSLSASWRRVRPPGVDDQSKCSPPDSVGSTTRSNAAPASDRAPNVTGPR